VPSLGCWTVESAPNRLKIVSPSGTQAMLTHTPDRRPAKPNCGGSGFPVVGGVAFEAKRGGRGARSASGNDAERDGKCLGVSCRSDLLHTR
jgi:hypothetical protein